MGYAVHLEPQSAPPSAVAYRWDADTEILSVRLAHAPGESHAGEATHVVELTGTDGSWLLLDLLGGAIDGVEIAVWPSDMSTEALRLPHELEHVRAILTSKRSSGAMLADRTVPMAIERDQQGRHLHLRVGPGRDARTVQLAQSLLLDVDPLDEIAGIWLLDVPPVPRRRPLA
ncbi:MAG: hypothetical protein MUF00_04480 [Gemmatimonadaceae bacterium]|nr:hypothetical protein [Gemmatimonadaceae bacterium]